MILIVDLDVVNGTDVDDVNIDDADVDEADIDGADVDAADVDGADVDGADVNGAAVDDAGMAVVDKTSDVKVFLDEVFVDINVGVVEFKAASDDDVTVPVDEVDCS